MATRTIVLRTDDITGVESEKVDSVTLKLPVLDDEGDISYVKVSFDAEPETVKGFMESLYKGIQTKYLNKSGVVVKAVSSGDSNEANENADMRAFAKARNLKVADRGRIAADIQKQYRDEVAAGTWESDYTRSQQEESDNSDSEQDS
jgi:hypothetical protein